MKTDESKSSPAQPFAQQTDKEKAIEQYKQALELDPNNQMAKHRLDDLQKPEKPANPPNPEKH